MRVAGFVLLILWSLCVFAQQTTVEVFPMQHRLPGELIQVIEPLVAPEGVVRASGNNLIVRATPQRMREIRGVLDKLDTPPKQLLISVRQGADLSDSERSASISGRVGNDSARIAIPPNQRDDANVILRDGNGNIVRGGVSDSTSSNQNTSTQQVRVLEGRSALIQVGQQRPVVERRVFPSVGRPVVIEQQGVQNITTGFRVLPRVHGQQFTLDISPQQANLRSRPGRFGDQGIVDVQRLNTSVSGPLGQWVDIGGAVQQQSLQSSGIGSTASSQSSTNTSVLIKVEELP